MRGKGEKKLNEERKFYAEIKKFIEDHEMALVNFLTLEHLSKDSLNTPSSPYIRYYEYQSEDGKIKLDSEWLVFPGESPVSVPLYTAKSGYGISSDKLKTMIREELQLPPEIPPDPLRKEPPVGGDLLS